MPSCDHRPTTRIIDILELLSKIPTGLSLTEIADAISAPKSSISPLMHTLTNRKFVFYDKDTQKYCIGIAAFVVGSSYVQQMTALQFIQSEMKHITDTCKETCQFGIRDNSQVFYMAKVDSPEPIQLVSHVGKRLPLYCTAIGKALLSDLSLEELKQLYPNGLQPYTESTITDFDTLFQQMKEIQISGIAKEYEEVTPHIVCVSTPLRRNGKIIAALSISVPRFRMTESKETQLMQLLLEKRNVIETYLKNYNIDSTSLTL